MREHGQRFVRLGERLSVALAHGIEAGEVEPDVDDFRAGASGEVAHHRGLGSAFVLLLEARELTVSMRAGNVRIAISDDGVATMTGPVAYCFSGYLDG